jgi:hypothetical protein
MHDRMKTIAGSVAAACFTMAFAAMTAHAGSNESEAIWQGVGTSTDWVTVEVKHAGRGMDTARLKKGTMATFWLRAETKAAQATTVLIDDKPGELSAIPEDASVHIVWRPAADGGYAMYATRIVFLTEKGIEVRKQKKVAKTEE